MEQRELIDLERQLWEALSSSGAASRSFFASVLADDVNMLFPGGMRLQGKNRILDSLDSQPWGSYEILEPRVLELAQGAGAVVYQVTAQREGSTPYVALISSTYVQRGGRWQLLLHQQTPV